MDVLIQSQLNFHQLPARGVGHPGCPAQFSFQTTPAPAPAARDLKGELPAQRPQSAKL